MLHEVLKPIISTTDRLSHTIIDWHDKNLINVAQIFNTDGGNFPYGYLVLDLCCGGARDGEGWLPVVAQGLGMLGARVYGVDLAAQPRNMTAYTHIRADILRQPLVEILPLETQFDLVIWLLTSINPPSEVYQKSLSEHPGKRMNIETAEDLIISQLPSLMVPGGLCMVQAHKFEGSTFYNFALLMKSDAGELIRLREYEKGWNQ